MASRLRQVPDDARRANMRPAAVLAVGPDDLAAALQCDFHDVPTNLGAARAVLLEAEPPARQFLLMRVLTSPDPGTELLVADDDDPAAAVAELLDAAGLTDEVVVWRLAPGDT